MKDRDQKAKALAYSVSKRWFPQLEVDVQAPHAVARKTALITDLDVFAAVPDDFVGRGSAIGDEIAVIGIKNARRIALRCAYRAVMVEQLPQLFHRIADIGAQHVFTIKLVVHLAYGRLQKRHATRMPRAVPAK